MNVIATGCDSFYFPALMALIRSLKKTNPSIPLIVFDGGLTVSQRVRVSFSAHVIRRDPFTTIKGRGKFSYIGNNTLLKFEVAELNYEKVLYLDADTVVAGNLTPVFELPSGKVGAVREKNTVRNMFRRQHRDMLQGAINIDWEEKGFNAGVFVLRPREWRDLKYRAAALIDGFGEDVFSKSKDQQLLNIIFSGRLHDLPREYNVSPVYDRDIRSPLIIHYLERTKPWHKGYPRDLSFQRFMDNITFFDAPGLYLSLKAAKEQSLRL
jgi:lipopolysaccharide biosynthesis glycosyltransferase